MDIELLTQYNNYKNIRILPCFFDDMDIYVDFNITSAGNSTNFDMVYYDKLNSGVLKFNISQFFNTSNYSKIFELNNQHIMLKNDLDNEFNHIKININIVNVYSK